jgi:hypothetical protein
MDQLRPRSSLLYIPLVSRHTDIQNYYEILEFVTSRDIVSLVGWRPWFFTLLTGGVFPVKNLMYHDLIYIVIFLVMHS